jgi:CO/xanthine dehydrogenase FAD-binding subunit
MNTAPDEILRPKTAEEAGMILEKLGDRAGLLWWGGRVEMPSTWTRPTMIDLSLLALEGIERREDWLVLGGLTPLQALVESDEVQAHFGGILHAAVRHTAHYGLRNLATLGGALFAPSGPPELRLALLTIGGQAAFAGASERLEPLERVLADPGPSGLVTEVRLPLSAGSAVGWGLEWVARSPMDMALAAAAAKLSLERGKIGEARLTVGSLGFMPQRIAAAESALQGQPAAKLDLSAVSAAVKAGITPASDFRATAEYQLEMMATLAARAIEGALEQAGAK